MVAGAPFVGEFNLRLATLSLITSVSVIGLYFAFGLTGLIHLAQAAFVGIGAYSSALIAQRAGISPWLALVGATLFTTAAAALLAYPMHRTRSHYLALTTVGFSVSFEVIVRNWEPVTGGYDGLAAIPLMRIGTSVGAELQYFFICAAFVIVSAAVAGLIRYSHLGRSMIAVRDDELAAAACGIHVARIKTKAFVICSAYGGLSGALYAHFGGFIAPDDFSLARSIMLLAMLIVGGEFSISGAVIGSFLLTYLPEWLRGIGSAYLAVFGVLMLLVLIVMPAGIVGSVGTWLRAPAAKER